MKLNNDNIKETIDSAKSLLSKEKNISPALRTIMHLLLVFMQAMLERLSLNSNNSSKPPSSDLNRKKSTKRNKTEKKPGGQPGRGGGRDLRLAEARQLGARRRGSRTLKTPDRSVDELVDFDLELRLRIAYRWQKFIKIRFVDALVSRLLVELLKDLRGRMACDQFLIEGLHHQFA